MSKYDIGVGEDFPLEDRPLDETRGQEDRGGRHGRRHHHHHHHDDHHRFHMAALAMLFALKAYRHRMRHRGETF